VRVDPDGVGTLPPGEERTQLGADGGAPRVGGVDVEPDAGVGAEVGQHGDGIDRGGRRRPDRRHERAGVGEVDAVDPHRMALVPGNRPDLELEQTRRLRGRGVRVLGADDDALARRRRPGGRERRDQSGRGGVLDMAVEALRQAEQVGEPGERHLLELLERGRGAPEDPDLVQRRDEELGEDPRLGGRRREVREVTRALPVRQPRHQDLVEVTEDGRERLRPFGRPLRESGPDRAGLDLRQHRQVAHALEVRRRPLERRGAVVAEVAHGRSFAISRQGRVLSTCSFVSQARRACATPSSR